MEDKDNFGSAYDLKIEIEIKQEHEEIIQDKAERDSDQENEYVEVELFEDESEFMELYEDHVIKDELVIGPEVIQKPFTYDVPKQNITSVTYQCDYCGKGYTRKMLLQNHVLAKHMNNEKRNICKHCSEIFISKRRLRGHIAKVCSKGKTKSADTVCKSNLNYHKKYCGSLNPDINNSSMNQNKIKENVEVTCHLCNKVLSKKHDLDYHIKYYCPKNQKDHAGTICHFCKKAFSSRSCRNKHQRHACPMNQDKTKRKRISGLCKFCDKVFSCKTALIQHLKTCPMNRSDTKPKEAICNYCNKAFSSMVTLSRHIKYSCPMNQNKLANATCNLCNKEVKLIYLNEHVKYNCTMNENKMIPEYRLNRLFKCDKCRRSYRCRSSIIKHVLICYN